MGREAWLEAGWMDVEDQLVTRRMDRQERLEAEQMGGIAFHIPQNLQSSCVLARNACTVRGMA